MSNSTSPIENGYLILADISGYTSFLSQTELDHAHEILTDLLETILKRFKTMLTIHKIEGDAIFAYSPLKLVTRGETLLELIETTYLDFRGRMRNVRRHTTCTCRACQSIPMLDLKFILHHGEFIVQNISGTPELAGSDVNLVHRLSKNHIEEETGWRAYTLFTKAALDSLQLKLEGLAESFKSYEHLGETRIFVMDLHARYESLLERQRVFISPEEADRVLEYDYDAPPEEIWEWFNEPAKRGQWMHSEIRPILRVGGRLAPGTRNHCVHGKNAIVVEDVLDIKPFEYYTVDHQPKGTPFALRMTFRFTPTSHEGTHLTLTLFCHAWFLPRWVGRSLTNSIVESNIKPHWGLGRIDELITSGTIS